MHLMDALNNTIGCNGTANNQTALARNYDAEGALKFTVAVVMVYGVAVIGVFAVSYVSRRKPQNFDVDKQARTYVKTLDNVRLKLERNNRLHSINSLLKNIHGGNELQVPKTKSIHDGILSYVAFPVMVASGDPPKSLTGSVKRSSSTGSETITSPLNSDYPSRQTLSVLAEENESEFDDIDVLIDNERTEKEKCEFFVSIS